MKFQNLIMLLSEADAPAAETKLLSDIWDENADSIASFRPVKKFAAKPAGNNMVEL